MLMYFFHVLDPTNQPYPPPTPSPHSPSSHSHPPMASSCGPEDEEDLKMKKPIYELTTLMQTVATSLAFKRHILDFKSETPEVETMLSQVQLLLVASFSSMLLMEVSSAPRKHMPSELLPADPLKDKVSAST